jgi:flagellar biosynthesis GTPase FlhF
MTIKTFHAASVQDAIRQARQELGSEAMLLSSKRVAGQKGAPEQFAVSFAYHPPAPGPAVPEAASSREQPAPARGTQPRPATAERLRDESPPAESAQERRRGGTPAANDRLGNNRATADSANSQSAEAYRLAHRAHRNPDEHFDLSEHRDLSKHRGVEESIHSGREAALGDEMAATSDGAAVDGARRVGPTPGSAGAEHAGALAESQENFDRLREQMLSLRREMLQLAGSVRRVSSASYRQELPSETLRNLYDLLVEQEFHADLIERILGSVAGKLGEVQKDHLAGTGSGRVEARRAGSNRGGKRRAETATPEIPGAGLAGGRLLPALQEAIATYVELAPEPSLRRKRTAPLVISLVGPPGAGKTTTLVKLAVRYSDASRFPLQLISMDNFRVGASEQLRAYAAVLGVGFDTLTTVRALEKAVNEYASKEIILIDTPGLGWKDFDAAEDLAAYLRSLEHGITHMVAPASMKPSDFERLADLYEAFDYQSLIYTKLDETTSIGQLVSESWRRRKPLSYFATGQRIPDDLELASRDRICERILPTEALSATFAA